jgi:UDP-N-acetylglucosamine--N-acetylmuramyl-(pentapeptide) pyrophosphoryl-undecaprenol N-acetylglucosamine transferase
LTQEIFTTQVLNLLQYPKKLDKMGENAKAISVPDSADKLATLVRKVMAPGLT